MTDGAVAPQLAIEIRSLAIPFKKLTIPCPARLLKRAQMQGGRRKAE
jgi:hypothetical protein